MNTRLRAVLGFLLMFMSHPLLACAVCGSGENDPTRDAYTGSTAFLSVVPLMAIGGIVYTVYRYVKKADEDNSEAEAAASIATTEDSIHEK